MSDDETMAERHGRMLARLSALALSLAENVQAKAIEAEAPEEAARLAHAFGRVANAVRQSVALEAKVAQDAERAARAQAAEADGALAAQRERRAAQARATVARAVDARSYGFQRQDLLRDLEVLVRDGQLFDGFADLGVEDQIAILSDRLEIPQEDIDAAILWPLGDDADDDEMDDADADGARRGKAPNAAAAADDADDEDGSGAPWVPEFDAAPPPAWRGAG